ncbi:MAG TPA: CBS domain-containing protein [Nitrospirota bacterium]
MDVITCHVNADFDALASMMAAKKLYPDAHVVFPGSQERSMREFFMQSTLYALHHERVKDIDMDAITRLILVDAKTPSRIGPFAEILGRPGLRVHIYDHHPYTGEDIRGEFEHVEKLGACTTIFVEILKEKGIPVTPVEATVMALGIYEETGSLVFASTTPRDIQAAAWLLSQGANLNIVADFITRELDAEQVSLLNDLLKSMTIQYFDGTKVAIATASISRYIQDIAVLAHKIRDMENLDALFCIVAMEGRVHMVARSRVEEVDAGAVAYLFGGGGHPTAASATIKDMNVDNAVRNLVKILKETVHPVKLAKEIMTSPVITIEDTATVEEAGGRMVRYNVNVLPVLSGDKLAGLVSREIMQKALHHGLGGRGVAEFMTTDFATAAPDTPFRKVEDIMISQTQRFLPVAVAGGLVGAITRTDLLRALNDTLPAGPKTRDLGARTIEDAFVKNVAPLIKERLPSEASSLLDKLGQVADELGFNAYVVGGFVRDLLMNEKNLDIDVVVEGPGIVFAREFAKKYPARVREHQKFGTAVVVPKSGMKFDVATARTEYYEYPAALPTVELGSIKKDLYRRDFTINALAIRINRDRFGDLIDFFGGQRDMKEKTIRVLHNLSLVEDPTRALRAIRFSVRMGFSISKHTQSLIRNAVKMELFNKLAGVRVYTELVLLFKETGPADAVEGLDEYGLTRFVHPKLKVDKDTRRLMAAIDETLTWFRLLYLEVEAEPWLACFMGLFDRLTEEELAGLGMGMAIPERHLKRLKVAKSDGEKALASFYRQPSMRPYQVYLLLKPLPVEVLLFMMAKAKKEHAKKKVSLYLTHYRDAHTILTGDDLKALGLPPGPGYKRVLEKLLEARLNGHMKTRDQEERFAAEYIRKHPELGEWPEKKPAAGAGAA